MKDWYRAQLNFPKIRTRESPEKSAQRRSQKGAGDYAHPFWPHQYEKSRYEKPGILKKPAPWRSARQGGRNGACQPCTSGSAYSAKHEIVLKSSEGKFYRSSSFCCLRL